MSGDYSRQRFDPRKHFNGVLMQQGRVQLDADWNEQGEILDRRWRAETTDLVGRCGVPMETPDGFKIQVSGTTLTIGRGRMYVHGLLAENHGGPPSAFDDILAELRGTTAVPYAQQPYLPDPPNLPQAGTHLVYLDVWQREVTYLEDPDLIERAIGVDSTARLQTVWQVKILPNVGGSVTCTTPDGQIPGWLDLTRPSAGRLSTATATLPGDPDPCLIPPSGGYKGLENQLYRVEIHTGGPPGSATFKWSRDNATVATSISAIPALDQLVVDSLGRDSVLRFGPGDWVEITDDPRELAGLPGQMRQIKSIDEATRTITLETPLTGGMFPTGPLGQTMPARHTRVRRWDQHGKVLDTNGTLLVDLDIPASAGVIPIPPAGTVIMLENGVSIAFDTVPAGGPFRVGDYWVFAARAADASLEQLQQAPPRGIHHHYCRLALLQVAANQPASVSDCRQLFPPVTELMSFFYVGGDGQAAMPGQTLPHPLQVGVANGKWPVAGAPVRFRISAGTGTLTAGPNTGLDLVVHTGPNGVAACVWRLDGVMQSQGVEATLVDGTHLPIRFNASLSRASAVAYDPTKCPALVNAQVRTVQEAIDQLCQAGDRAPGIHITRVMLNTGQLLRNDTDVPVAALAQGLQVVCDANVDQDSVRQKPTCFVTLEMPFPFSTVDQQLWGNPVIGFQPLILAANVNADNNVVFWSPTPATTTWLQTRLFQMMQDLRRGNRLLARLTLKGNFIWGQQDPQLYLDGEAFGVRVPGATHTDLRLPSGDGRRGGDFEMWFWLVPPAPSPTLTATAPTLTTTLPTAPTLTTTLPTLTTTRPTLPTLTAFPPIGIPTSPGGIAAPSVIVSPRTGAAPLTAVRGVSDALAGRLIAAGIQDVQALASATPAAVASALGFRRQARAQSLIEEAKRLLEQT